MPHPSLDAQVRLDQHPDHATAVTAIITGPGTPTARAVLSSYGFRLVGEAMVLARIDREEPHYAAQAADALRADGVLVEITAGLQDAVDTEWTWSHHPMRWLTRQEIREVSAEAQQIHDDIAVGRLAIHLHAYDGWTTVAVGTYTDGRCVHLHGENHLRVIAATFDSPREAIEEFQHQHGNAAHPGPAPATDTEREATEALTETTPPAATAQTSPPPEPVLETVPVYAADPGDHEELLNTFLDTHGEWEKYRTWSDDTTHASHEDLTLRVEFDHEAGPRDTKWTIAAYESPVGDRLWHATATATVPKELMSAFLDCLAEGHAHEGPPLTNVSEQTIVEATRPLAEAVWHSAVEGRQLRWAAPNGHAAGVHFDTFAAQRHDSLLPAWTLWGGNTPHQPDWAIHLSRHTPPAVLQDLTFEAAHGLALRHRSTKTPSPVRQVRPAPTPPPPGLTNSNAAPRR